MGIFTIVFKHDPFIPATDPRYKPLYDAIRRFDHKFITNCAYLIKTDDSADEVWDKLHNNNAVILGSDDRLYLLAVCKPYEGHCPNDVRAWLETNLPSQQTWRTTHIKP